ncbi:MAG TPA: hypothetical protein VFR51_17120, partial [Pyrinomonadaceae bacterium]|nr:hypothetical protein [Pyrinomonadaceae bacterium]
GPIVFNGKRPSSGIPLKQTLDARFPRVLGFLSGPLSEARFVTMPAPSVHTHKAPPMVQFS